MGILTDKTAIVTGSARGIGKDIAIKLASEGCNVVISDIDVDGIEQTTREISAMGHRALAVRTDVSSVEETDALIKKCVDEFGAVDILVNNAGIVRDNLLIRMKEDEWDSVINVNLKGTFNCTKAVAKVMMKKRTGCIINITSVVGIIGNITQANYASSKAGVIGLTKSTAKELAGRGIRVNAIAPGFIETAMTAKLADEIKENYLKTIPLNCLGSPEDIANTVVFLASPSARYITGQVINVDGGMVM